MGWLLFGIRGGLVAGILFVLPSVFVLLLLSLFYVIFGNLPIVVSIFSGLKPAVIAIIITALFKISSRSLITVLHYIIAIASFIAIFMFNVPFPLILLSAFLIGFVLQKIKPSFFQWEKSDKKFNSENDYFINSESVIPHTAYNKLQLLKMIISFISLWLLPFVLIYAFVNDKFFWINLSAFFTKAAMVTFGGAYAVLPYVAQVSVEKFHWLSNLQMMDGLAMGETTPGPLIMVLAFVGFMGAYNHYNFSLLHGALGLLTTVWFTFLPCFLFIFVGAPLIEKSQNNLKTKNLLSIISSAIVGVMLSLAIYLLKAVLFPSGFILESINWFNLFWIIISFVFLYRFKINMILWIVISALAGLGYYMAFL
jgi:chromate transporter